jgi:hypothetical protein
VLAHAHLGRIGTVCGQQTGWGGLRLGVHRFLYHVLSLVDGGLGTGSGEQNGVTTEIGERKTQGTIGPGFLDDWNGAYSCGLIPSSRRRWPDR